MSRKIPDYVVQEMQEAISYVNTPEARERYRTGNFPRSEFVKDLDKRYRWDLLWASGFRITDLYDRFDANDTHIDTALRQIVNPL